MGKIFNDVKFKNQIQNWYKQLFKLHVQSGFMQPSLLAGYRNKPVFIKGFRHIPVNYVCLHDVMEQYLKLLDKEDSPWVQALVGFIYAGLYTSFSRWEWKNSAVFNECCFCFIWMELDDHQTAGKYTYFKALEKASVYGDIRDFERLFIRK